MHLSLPHTPFPRYEGLEVPPSREPTGQKARARKHPERRKARMVSKDHRQPQGALSIKVPTLGCSPNAQSLFTFNNLDHPPPPTHLPTPPVQISHTAFIQPSFSVGPTQSQESAQKRASNESTKGSGKGQERANVKPTQENAQEQASDEPVQTLVQE